VLEKTRTNLFAAIAPVKGGEPQGGKGKSPYHLRDTNVLLSVLRNSSWGKVKTSPAPAVAKNALTTGSHSSNKNREGDFRSQRRCTESCPGIAIRKGGGDREVGYSIRTYGDGLQSSRGMLRRIKATNSCACLFLRQRRRAEEGYGHGSEGLRSRRSDQVIIGVWRA